MCGFMIETRSNLPNAPKIINEAKVALEKAEKDEQSIEKLMSDWQSKNKKWKRGKRGKKKNKEPSTKMTDTESGNIRWLETFAKQLKSEGTLSNDGDLTNMKAFKVAMFRWTDYIKRQNF